MLIRNPKRTASYQSFLQFSFSSLRFSTRTRQYRKWKFRVGFSSWKNAKPAEISCASWVGHRSSIICSDGPAWKQKPPQLGWKWRGVFFFVVLSSSFFFQSAQHLGLKSCRRSASSRQPYVTASTPTPPLGIAASGDLPGRGVCMDHEKPFVPRTLWRGAAQPAVLQASRSFTFYL